MMRMQVMPTPAMASGSASLRVVVLLLLSTWACVASGQDDGGGGGGGAAGMACVKKLLPCQPFLQRPDETPTPSCCVPLTEALRTETPCLCGIFNNEAMLRSLNVTKDEAVQLLKACKAAADLKVCDSSAATNGTSSAAPAGAPPKTDPSGSNGSNSPPKGSAVSVKSMWASGSVLAAVWVALHTLAFY